MASSDLDPQVFQKRLNQGSAGQRLIMGNLGKYDSYMHFFFILQGQYTSFNFGISTQSETSS